MPSSASAAFRSRYGKYLPHQHFNVDPVPLPFVNGMDDTRSRFAPVHSLPTLGGSTFATLAQPDAAAASSSDAAKSPVESAKSPVESAPADPIRVPPTNPIRVPKAQRAKRSALPVAAAAAVEARQALRRRGASRGDAVAAGAVAVQSKRSFGLNLEGAIAPSPPAEDAGECRRARAFKAKRDASAARGAGDIERVLERCEVTPAELALAGFSAEESTRLQNALFVYSQGLRALFAELFGEKPQRAALLRRVWAGFACLLEATGEEGGVLQAGSPLAAMARQQREHAAELAHARAEGEARLASAAKAGEARVAAAAASAAAAARGEGRAALAEARAEAARGAHELGAARAELREAWAERDREARLRLEAVAAHRAAAEQLKPLAADQAALRELKAAVPQLKQAADKLRHELGQQRDRRQSLEAALRLAAVGEQLWRAELAPADAALLAAEGALSEARLEAAALRRQLALEAAQVERMQADAAERRDEARQARQALLAQLDAAAADVADARQERNDAELRRADAEGRRAALQAELAQRDELLASKGRQLAEATARLRAREDEAAAAERRAAAQREKAERAREAEARAVDEAEAAQRHGKQLLDAQARLRDELQRGAREAEGAEREAWRREEGLRGEAHRATVAARGAAAKTDELEQLLRAAEARIARLAADVERGECARGELEAAQQARLTKERQTALKLKFEHKIKLARHETRAQQDARQLGATLAAFSELGAHFAAMQRDVAELTAHNECLAAELREWKEAMAAAGGLGVAVELMRAIEADLARLGGGVQHQLAFQLEQQRALDAGAAALDGASAQLGAARASAEALLPMAERALEVEAALGELRPSLATAEAEAARRGARLRAVQEELAAARAQHEAALAGQADAMRDELEAAHTGQREARRAERAARCARAVAEEELAEWRVGNVRVATYKKWKVEFDERVRAQAAADDDDGAADAAASAAGTRGEFGRAASSLTPSALEHAKRTLQFDETPPPPPPEPDEPPPPPPPPAGQQAAVVRLELPPTFD